MGCHDILSQLFSRLCPRNLFSRKRLRGGDVRGVEGEPFKRTQELGRLLSSLGRRTERLWGAYFLFFGETRGSGGTRRKCPSCVSRAVVPVARRKRRQEK